jgi:dipeptidyl aminopeptidase/acylaminoacyl peptidase
MRLEGSDFMLGPPVCEHAEYTRYNISYRSNGLLITGIMNIPKGNGPFPLLVFNHGYIDPAVYTRGRGLKREQDYLARQGFAVLHTDYRGHADSQPSPMTDKVYDGNLEYAMDSANAILALRQANLPTVDTLRVGMLGHSMGGGVTLAILTARPDLVDAAVLYAPVHADVWENFSRWRSKREEGDRTVEQFGTREENPTWWNELSPQSYLATIRAPVLLLQGRKDADVPAEWSDALAERLRSLGKEFRYVEYAAEGHEFASEWQDFMEQTTAFFRQHLEQH